MANQISVHLVKLPAPENAVFTDEYIDEFNHYYNNLKENYPDIAVDWFPSYPQNRFYDGGHMNSHGALQLSLQIKKMYPEDFDGANLSSNQALAINDTIKTENKVEWLLNWILKRDYTILLYDEKGILEKNWSNFKRGIIDDIWEEVEEQAKYEIRMWNLVNSNTSDVYCIEGIDGNSENISAFWMEDNLVVKLKGQEPQSWIITPEDAIEVMVIDNYNQEIVCTKSFQYIDDVFMIMQ